MSLFPLRAGKMIQNPVVHVIIELKRVEITENGIRIMTIP